MPHFDCYISCEDAAAHLHDPDWLFVDCRFFLADKSQGRREYEDAHVAGAVFADLDGDLSAPHVPGRSGRHPLPEPGDFVRTLQRLGVTSRTQVVAYDAQAGQLAAGRLWWMLHWAGHTAAAVLDGGITHWRALGLPLRSGVEARSPSDFTASFDDALQISAEEITRDPSLTLLDARAADRFRGENETLDPVGGRIPGAVNRFYRDNLGADGRFKPAAQLRAELDAVAAGRAPAELVMQCGSGVTACHNLLALELAGLSGAALYPGSWSEWSAWPGAPVATGPAA